MPTAAAAARLPAGFTDTPLTGELSPPVLNIRDRICWDKERGVEGIAIDPDFASNRRFYLYYTFDKHHTVTRQHGCASKSSRSPVNRVSRFTLGPNGRVDPKSEKVLLDNIPSYEGNHNSGDLGFGKDGYLYVSVGDGGCDYARDSGCAKENDAARDRNVLLGKILRITRDGGVPADNPFVGSRSARCAGTGRTRRGLTCAETWAWGLRNPFRFAFDPNAAGSRMFINDVGETQWDEIDLGAPGADYGWNEREGHCLTGGTVTCPPPGRTTNPIFDYLHSSGCSAITGGAFVPRGLWPGRYEGGYLFADFTCGKIRLLQRVGRKYVASPFASRMGPVIDLAFGPPSAPKALYYTVWKLKQNRWEVRKITYSPPANSSGRSFCGGGIGTSLALLGLCCVPYVRRRLRATR
jgi:glucose/arabinose dehydrogenase